MSSPAPHLDLLHRGSSSAALEHVRTSVDACRRQCNDLLRGRSAAPVRTVGIIGAGIMGAAIAVDHAARSIDVILCDTNLHALQRAAALGAKELAAVRRTGMCHSPGRITCTQDEMDLVNCDLVLESIVERAPAKQAVLQGVAHLMGGKAILATNTSTIPLARLAQGLDDAGRFCGLHFCHPVWCRPLVEVIRGEGTSPETLATVVAHAQSIGKLALVVRDGPGFVVNRLLLAYLNEALALLVSGHAPEAVDDAMVAFGMPLGPLAMMDEIGLDTALHSGMVLGDMFEERPQGTELLVRLVKEKQLGCKTQGGVYLYPSMRRNPVFSRILDGIRGASSGRVPRNEPDGIATRLLQPMISVGARLVAEGRVDHAWQVDLAAVFGLGFPLCYGGLMKRR